MKIIKAIANTKVKDRPIDSSLLEKHEYQPIHTGKELKVTSIQRIGSHSKISIFKKPGFVYIYNPDWQGLNSGNSQLIDIDENNIAQSLVESAKQFGLTLKTQHAYILATVEWETARTFKPVKEAYWLSESWRKNNLRYFPYYGRGYVQLTWLSNYQKYKEILGVDFVRYPDKVMNPKYAAYILNHGFKHGVFTGRKLEDYIRAGKTDFINARRCINGTDKQHQIANLANKYLRILK